MRRAAILALLALAACDEMADQPKAKVYGASDLFADGMAMQAPPAGTVARDAWARQAAIDTPPPMSPALVARGADRYAIFCAVCHDAAGYGNGAVPARGYPHPPSLHDDARRALTDRQIVQVIGEGHGVMYGYGDRIEPADRWAITAYVRALQLSQATPLAALAADEQAKAGGRP